MVRTYRQFTVAASGRRGGEGRGAYTSDARVWGGWDVRGGGRQVIRELRQATFLTTCMSTRSQ